MGPDFLKPVGDVQVWQPPCRLAMLGPLQSIISLRAILMNDDFEWQKANTVPTLMFLIGMGCFTAEFFERRQLPWKYSENNWFR